MWWWCWWWQWWWFAYEYAPLCSLFVEHGSLLCTNVCMILLRAAEHRARDLLSLFWLVASRRVSMLSRRRRRRHARASLSQRRRFACSASGARWRDIAAAAARLRFMKRVFQKPRATKQQAQAYTQHRVEEGKKLLFVVVAVSSISPRERTDRPRTMTKKRRAWSAGIMPSHTHHMYYITNTICCLRGGIDVRRRQEKNATHALFVHAVALGPVVFLQQYGGIGSFSRRFVLNIVYTTVIKCA